MKKLFMSVALLILVVTSFAQTPGYEFTTVVSHQATPVKDQGSTGTCWCFATASFMESELLRMGKGEYDLSEMFIVRQKYMNQMEDNYLRRGKGSIGEGSLAHTFKNAYKKAGIVPEEVYTGLPGDKKDHNHGALSRYLKALVDANIESKKRTPQFDALINNLFDIYLGKVPEKFTYKGKEYTPQSFTESLGLNMDDYVELTSFTHKPYYETFSPEVPDNWENQPMYNLPLDELIGVIDYALNKGYTVCWDGDVSHNGFSHPNGLAILPTNNPEEMINAEIDKWTTLSAKDRERKMQSFESPVPEMKVDDNKRQFTFNNRQTTDDHLMHITGMLKDQNGTIYYKTKNSWGEDRNSFGGYLYMSEPFCRLQTVAIMVHKDAIPKAIRKKLGL